MTDLKENSSGQEVEVKTSAERNDIDGVTILDADGWNRQNFQYSFYEEKITQAEYNKRLCYSTIIRTNKNIQGKRKIYKLYDSYSNEGIIYCVVATSSKEARKMISFNTQYLIGSDYDTYFEFIKSLRVKRMKELDGSKYPIGELDQEEGLKIGAYTWID